MGATSGKLGNSGAAETFQSSVLQCPVQVSHKDDDNGRNDPSCPGGHDDDD